jgi:phosphatidylserine/phosphatidylglycerophosphate/cardiolipin synthase-like enzyme
MMSCAHSSSDIQILDKSEDGLLSKMEALLGYKPGVEFLKNGNPYAELDFSKAPKLDAIFISTLLYRRDFTGTVIGRLLKFHAERGAIVNIIGTGYMQDEKDKSLLKELSQVKGNIRVQEYKFIDANGPIKSPGAYLSNYLRDFHVKMFVTLSSTNPKDNVVITGGRNIHDGFHFAEKPDFSKYPEIQQSPEGAYAYWNDLEIKISSETVARSAYGLLLKFWNRKVKGQVTEKLSVKTEAIDASDILNSNETQMRHFLSLPFNDDQALEKLYVDMIDKAETSIRLSSPYLRPTKAIMNAFKRAIERKVQVTIQTRINLAGDTQAWLYEETNKAAINDLFEHVKLYEWMENSILHTKMMIIDDKFAFFGSVNLSRRSFIQDVESGYIIHDPNFVGKLAEVFDNYRHKSRVIDEKQKRKFWASIFVFLFQNQF